jgi:chromosomal replication initiator protein
MKVFDQKIKDRLKEITDPNSYEMWLKNLDFTMEKDTLHVKAPAAFSMTMVRELFSERIAKVSQEVHSKEIKVIFDFDKNSTGNAVEKKAQGDQDLLKATSMEKSTKNLVDKTNHTNYFEIEPHTDLKLNPKFTFNTFVIGKNNQFACAAAKAVIQSPGVTYNPLFIYGNTGLGKTHLMQAIGHGVKEQDKRKKVVYMPCEEFTNLMIEAIQKGTMSAFRARFRKVDILMVDDIQFLAKKEQTQEEFFNTFNALYNEHKQIVLSSDFQPKELIHLQQRLVSRFEWGLVTDIQPPAYETRVSILNKKCELSNLRIPEEVIHFLSENIVNNVRQMEGALNRVYTYAKLLGKILTVDLTREFLKDLIKTEKAKRITVDHIQNQVVKFYNITLLQLQGPKRLKNYALPRQVAMYLSRTLTDLSLPEIGMAFGGRDHTTVLHAYRKIERQIQTDKRLHQEIDSLNQVLLVQN